MLKLIAKHTREYNELSVKYTDLGSKHRDLTNNYVNLKLINAQALRENKALKSLLDTAEQMLAQLRGKKEVGFDGFLENNEARKKHLNKPKYDLSLCLFCKKWDVKCKSALEFRRTCLINNNELYDPIEERLPDATGGEALKG